MAAEPIPAPRPKTGIPKNPGRRELGMTATLLNELDRRVNLKCL